MNKRSSTTPIHRDQALRRLRSITVGAAATGIAAVVGFGGVAAATYTGHATATAAPLAATGSSTTSAVASTVAGATATTAPASASPAPSTMTTITGSSAGSGQVTTGGS